MAVLDWILLCILALSTLVSLYRGFVKEALSLVTWITAILVARFLGLPFSMMLEPYIEMDPLRLGVSYLTLFVLTLVTGALISRMFGELMKISGLKGLDRTLGMAFGLARGGILVTLIVAVLHYVLPVAEDDWYKRSILAPEVVSLIEQYGPGIQKQGVALFQPGQQG